MAMPAVRRHWTSAQVRALMDESRPWARYELIGGELLVTPAPGSPHQIVVLELEHVLRQYVDRQRLGVTFVSPADLELLPDSIVQPDVFVVPAGSGQGTGTRGWDFVRSLLLAVEVVSPSGSRADRVTKRDYYMEAGVPEYWVVDWDARVFERWTPSQETPTIHRDRVVWTPDPKIEPLVVDVAALFLEVATKVKLLRV